MAQNTIKAFKQLEEEDFKVLKAIEKGMHSHEHVPVRIISILSKFPEDEVMYRVDKLNKLDLIIRWIKGYVGYELKSTGHDCLAINALVQSNCIEAIGRTIGVGKESDVYEALTPKKRHVVIKIHRLGRTSFRQTRRLRPYTRGEKHHSWLHESQIAAKREYKALTMIYPVIQSVPEPIGHNRHCVVMEIINGEELENILELLNPESVLDKVVEITRIIYQSCGVIHADLSAFNILYNPEDNTVTLIDWPQWVKTTHPNAELLLKRDVKTILGFFKRRFGVIRTAKEVLDYLKESES